METNKNSRQGGGEGAVSGAGQWNQNIMSDAVG